MIQLSSLSPDQRGRLAASDFGALRPSEIPANWESILAGQAVLDAMWRHRTCFVCNKTGRCGHREVEADLAEMTAIENRLRTREVIL